MQSTRQQTVQSTTEALGKHGRRFESPGAQPDGYDGTVSKGRAKNSGHSVLMLSVCEGHTV